MFDLVIIGGGAAALAAAVYAKGKRLSTALVAPQLGGKIGWSERLNLRDWEPKPPRYLVANEHVRLLRTQALPVASIIDDEVVRLAPSTGGWQVETGTHGMVEGVAVLVATGATPLQLHVPGAERWIERGAGYSITTYAHEVGGRRVAVIGGTMRALQGVVELAQGAERVYVVLPHGDNLVTSLGRALRHAPNVELLLDCEVTELCGFDHLEEIVVVYNDQSRRLSVTRAFVDLGLVPNSGMLQGIASTDAEGFILVDRDNATTAPGVFAAGDVTAMPGEQVFVAMGDGARAAQSAYRHILMRRLVAAHA